MNNIKYILIAGSAGSFKIITEIVEALPKNFPYAVILVLHRLRHIKQGFKEALSAKSEMEISEPFDKEKIELNRIYIAPANYHLFLEPDSTFALSIEEAVNHSRPAIDLSFSSAGKSLKDKVLGILLSGANKDGAVGLRHIKENGGKIIIQNPDDAVVRTMPDAGIKEIKPDKILSSKEIINFLLSLN